MPLFSPPTPNRFSIAMVMLALAGCFAAAAAGQTPPAYEQLQFRHIGPVGNRISAVAGVHGDPSTYWAGAASGGIWKSTDAGLTWKPVFDAQSVHSIGALSVAPSDSQIIWAGTGESFIRSNVSIGNGVYLSSDAGKTWQHKGLDKTGRISRILIHPTRPEIVYVAALGHGYSPQAERGVYRTLDGGDTWEQVLFVDENTGASDLVMDPNNPRILFAGMWQLEIRTWTRESGGPGSGIFVSRDAGESWTRIEGHGLPKLPVGKVALCMTPADSSRIYALIETGDGVPWHGQETESGELWRSDDGGENWLLVNHSHDLAGRTAYYSRCAVAPDDPNEAYFPASGFSITYDGGKTSEVQQFLQGPGWDHHDVWIDLSDGRRMAVAHDGGISISENRGRSWFRVQLPVAQMYHVTVDNKIPYNVLGNRQDGPSVRGPSNSRLEQDFGPLGIPRGMWHSVGGGESGFATPDPVDPDIIWSSTSGYGPVGGIVTRYNERTRQYRQVEVWPEAPIGWPAADLKYRFQWTFPLLISPHDHNTVYVTSQMVHRTRNGGQSWEVISPDLTTNDKSKQGISGGLTPDNIGVEYCCVVYALDESPAEAGVLWAGTNDGLIHLSRDGGRNWTQVSSNIADLPPLGTVRNIDASKWSAGKAYVTIDFHQVGNFDPYVYKTEDFGRSWTKITDGIMESPLSYVRNIREDPVRPGLLYLGTENALYVSFDDGGHWQQLHGKLPPTPVYWIAVQEHFNDLVLGTYGRGFWILDDITPLQQLTPDVKEAPVHLFEPRDAYRFRPITAPMFMFDDPSAGQNPPYGASINYWFKEKPGEAVSLRFLDASGNTVRTLKDKDLEGKTEAGINRVWWDLRSEPSVEIKLRTPPPHASWVKLKEDGTRAAVANRISTLLPPGQYTVVLQVGEKEFSRPLRVLKDPNTEGSEEDIGRQVELIERLRQDMNQTAEMINQIELLRVQLNNLAALLKDRSESPEESQVVQQAKSLEIKVREIEAGLYQLELTGTGQDVIRWPARLAGRIAYLAAAVDSADFPPADQHLEVAELLEGRLAAQKAALQDWIDADLAEFNRLLRENNLAGVIALK